MVIFKDLFGQKEEIEKKDYFDYDIIPKEVRQKVYFTIHENAFHVSGWNQFFEIDQLRYLISKHKGIPNINNESSDSSSIQKWLLECNTIEFLQTIEIFIWMRCKDDTSGCEERLKNTIIEINDSFNIHKIGYEIVENKIIRKDSMYLHKEVIKEALFLLKDKKFNNAFVEFEKALENHTLKYDKEAITYSNAAFESTMKIILNKTTGDATQLISDLLKCEINSKRLIPNYYTSFLEDFKKILQAVPITRNEKGKGLSHGSGTEESKVDPSFAELALHMTGTLIVFLIRRYNEIR